MCEVSVKKVRDSSPKMSSNAHSGLFMLLGMLTVVYAVYERIESQQQADMTQGVNGLRLPMLTALDRHHKHKLKMDEAFLNIISPRPGVSIEVFMQYNICHKCPLVSVANVSEGENVTLVVKTQFPVALKAIDGHTGDYICNITSYHFGEHGVYDFYVQEMMTKKICNFVTRVEPENSAIPLAVLLSLILGAALVYWGACYLHKHHYIPFLTEETEEFVYSDLGDTSIQQEEPMSPPQVAKRQRLRSLDTFRGISLVLMVLVNYGGGGYWFFHHSVWNGITVADLVFPWFTFIMGTSMSMSVKGQIQKGATRKELALRVVKRATILFLLGLVISNHSKGNEAVSLNNVRIPGVLQRLGFTFLCVALTEVTFVRVDTALNAPHWIGDIVVFFPHMLVMFGFIALYLCLTFLLPVPGCPKGYLGPGGLGESDPKYYNCTGGAAAYIDKVIFGEAHIYQHPTCKKWYLTTAAHDPEGILGTLTSVVICFLGLHAGKVLSVYSDYKHRIMRWFAHAILTGLIAGILCKFSMNGGWIPVNKNLWSLSFVLSLASMAYITLIALYLLVDVYKVWSGAPFFFVGMNSIVVYMCHEVFENYFPIQFKVPDTHACQLAMAVYGTTIWIVVAGIMYRKKVFIAI